MSYIYVQDERYNAVPWMARSVYVYFECDITIKQPLFVILSFKVLRLPCTFKQRKSQRFKSLAFYVDKLCIILQFNGVMRPLVEQGYVETLHYSLMNLIALELQQAIMRPLLLYF